jgi:hypothetical protein
MNRTFAITAYLNTFISMFYSYDQAYNYQNYKTYKLFQIVAESLNRLKDR